MRFIILELLNNSYFIAVSIISLTLLVVSVEHDAEYDPNQANDEGDNSADQSNGGPRLHAQDSAVMQNQIKTLFKIANRDDFQIKQRGPYRWIMT